MRGTPVSYHPYSGGHGIIPAYAGNTWYHQFSYLHGRDHPRVCGEHLPLTVFIHSRMGSSPRMRGTRGPRREPVHRRGIIPAYAGNTRRARPADPAGRDHPRVCGEHEFTDCTMAKYGGSSPRMRGTLDPAHPEIDQTGIIPAYAGNTGRWPPFRHRPWDHPRVCGEHGCAYVANHRL